MWWDFYLSADEKRKRDAGGTDGDGKATKRAKAMQYGHMTAVPRRANTVSEPQIEGTASNSRSSSIITSASTSMSTSIGASASTSTSKNTQSTTKTCRRCYKKFDPAKNHHRACRTHPESFSGIS